MMTTYTIYVDAREKKPLPFPATLQLTDMSRPSFASRLDTVALKTQTKTLKTADYLLGPTSVDHPLGFGAAYSSESVVAIETKRSLSEIAGNVLPSHGRKLFVDCLRRLSSFPRALLLVEGGLSTLYSNPLPGTSFSPICARDHLISLCFQYGVHLHMLDGTTPASRLRNADYVARLLILGGVPRCPPSADSHPELSSTRPTPSAPASPTPSC